MEKTTFEGAKKNWGKCKLEFVEPLQHVSCMYGGKTALLDYVNTKSGYV